MEKLKANLYSISLVAVVLALGGLAWLLVLSPIYGSASTSLSQQESELDGLLRDTKSILSAESVPTEDYQERQELNLRTQRNDYNEAVRFYNSRREEFNKFFDGTSDVPDVASFAAEHDEQLSDLIGQYREKFQIREEEGDEDRAPEETENENSNPKTEEATS